MGHYGFLGFAHISACVKLTSEHSEWLSCIHYKYLKTKTWSLIEQSRSKKIATLIQLSLISTQWSTKSGKRAMFSISHWGISTLWSGRYNFCWYLKNYTMNQLKGTRFFRVKNVDFFLEMTCRIILFADPLVWRVPPVCCSVIGVDKPIKRTTHVISTAMFDH